MRVITNFARVFCNCLVGSRVRATLSYVSRLCRCPTISPLTSRFPVTAQLLVCVANDIDCLTARVLIVNVSSISILGINV